MGDLNQITYLRRHLPRLNGPILEIGSKEYGSTSSFREFYRENEYVGADMSEGSGVDVIVDLTKGLGPLPERHFALIICCSVLEHVDRPWLFADNLCRLLHPSGVLYMAVPWVWRFHPYPDDYFRFSHRGICALFPDIDWHHVELSTNVTNEFAKVKPGIDTALAVHFEAGQETRKYLPYLQYHMLGTPRKLAPPSSAIQG